MTRYCRACDGGQDDVRCTCTGEDYGFVRILREADLAACICEANGYPRGFHHAPHCPCWRPERVPQVQPFDSAEWMGRGSIRYSRFTWQPDDVELVE
jgi:hypothetical protein